MTSSQSIQTFSISALIRITLLSLYIALTVPLPFLAVITPVSIPVSLFVIGLGVGWILLYGALGQRVILDEKQIAVTYPRWFPSFLQKGWSLPWQEIEQLKLRTTGQGGLVYYFVTSKRDQAYLLPMRVAGFNQLVQVVQEKTGIDTSDVRPLAQPWMYLILLGFTFLLLLIDTWTIWTAINISY
ncbi:MAG: hypothetical protein RI580_15415 [Halothece sp. Uz-M2-17]|nr:hypothetical protein [Halothece sp. Uz-M2-17]